MSYSQKVSYRIYQIPLKISPRDLNGLLHTYFQKGEYPLYDQLGYKKIQIKMIRLKGQRIPAPHLVVLDLAIPYVETHIEFIVDEVRQGTRSLRKQGKDIVVPIPQVVVDTEVEFGLVDRPIVYQVYNYLPFNTENYQEYSTRIKPNAQIKKDGDTWTWYDPEIIAMLEVGLYDHVQTCISALGLSDWPPLAKVALFGPVTSRMAKLKDNIYTPVFNIRFTSNLLIPEFIGLGKKISVGYGTIHHG